MNWSEIKRTSFFLILSVTFGCADQPNTTTGALAGGAVGAGTGAIIGHQSGHGGEGALIGGAAGALVGAGVGSTMDEAEEATYPEDEVIRRQHAHMERQQREVEDLKRQRYHDDLYRKRITAVRRNSVSEIPEVPLD